MKSNVEIVKSFYTDDSALFDALAPDVEWHETEGLPYGGVYRGVEALMEGVFAHVMTDWEGFSATPDTVLAVGEDQVLSMGRYGGVFRSTGKATDAAFAHLYKLKNGKVVQFRQCADSAVFRAAMS